MPQYLPRAGTFIYSAIIFQERSSPIVITRTLAHEEEFPLPGPIYSTSSSVRPRADRLVALIRGYGEAYELLIERAAKQEQCALLHAHHGWSGRASVRPAKRLGIPLVTTFYGRDLALRKSRKAIRQPYHRLFADGAAFVCEGPAMARHLSSLGCDPEKIAVIKIGIDLSAFVFRVPTRDRPFTVVQAARFVEKKGFDLTLRAFAEALPVIGEAELLLVGDGELRSNCEQLARDLGIASRVRFLGECSYEEYRELTARAHVCMQPSRVASDGDTEGGAPTVLLEMQARGVPIVATRHADIPSVVAFPNMLADEEDVSALAARLAEIASLSDDEYSARAFAGRAYVEAEHDVRLTVAQLEQLYDRVLAGAAIHSDAEDAVLYA